MGAVTADDRPGPIPSLDDSLALLSERARRRNVERTGRVLELLGTGGAPDPGSREQAARLCHDLAGSAGTFGDAALTDAARHLEDVLRAGRGAEIPDALDGLRRAARLDGPGT